MATPIKLATESDARQAREALEERLVATDASEERLAELERDIAFVAKRLKEVEADVAAARGALISSKDALTDVDHSVHHLGVRLAQLDELMAHPGRRQRVLLHAEGLAESAGPAGGPLTPTGPRVVVSARWGAPVAAPGAAVAMQAIVDGFADGTPARLRVFVRGTDRTAGTVDSEVRGGRVAGLWKAGPPEEYEFVVEVTELLARSGPLRVGATSLAP